MPLLFICKFDKDPINNEHASVGTSFSHEKFFQCSRAGNTEVKIPIKVEFELI